MNGAIPVESRALADWYPYWFVEGGVTRWSRWAGEAAAALPAQRRQLDPVSVLSLLSFEFICLDRTMVDGVSRLPWMGGVDERGAVHTFYAPPHGTTRLTPEAIARELWTRLSNELADATAGAKRVYVLLSGGMDSRVVAGVLRGLQRSGRLTVPVEARTWGIEGTRDVVYAERLARTLGWHWEHLPLGPEHLWRNFETGAQFLGAECDPKHLHRMTAFEGTEPGAVVVAGSYGDSIGRAEYSSRHLSVVEPLTPSDKFQLLKPRWREWAEPRLHADIYALRDRHGSRSELGSRELERQAHYMRRQLCHPMSIINRWAKLHQAFSSPEVFGFMWSLDASVRNDQVYRALLQTFASDLLNVEWARTGGRYQSGNEAGDTLRKGFHRYGRWLRVDLKDRLLPLLDDGVLEHLEIFDMRQVRFMTREWLRERDGDDTMLATQLSMLGVLSMFARRFELEAPRERAPFSLGTTVAQQPRRYLARAKQVAARLSRPLRFRKES